MAEILGTQHKIVQSDNGGTITTTDGKTYQKIGNFFGYAGMPIFTHDNICYGNLVTGGGGGSAMLTSKCIPLVTTSRDLKWSNLNGLIKEIIKIETIDVDDNLNASYVLAVGKHRIWLIIGAEIKSYFKNLVAISLDGKEKIVINDYTSYKQLLDVNVDYEGNLLMLLLEQKSDYSGLVMYATKNGVRYWEKSTSYIAQGRINKDGNVQYIVNEVTYTTSQSEPHEVDMYKTVDVPPSVQIYKDTSEVKWNFGFMLQDAPIQAAGGDDSYGMCEIVLGNYGSFQEMAENFDLGFRGWDFDFKIPAGIYTDVLPDYEFFYGKISADDIKQIDYTYKSTNKIISNSGVLYERESIDYSRNIVCTKKDFSASIEIGKENKHEYLYITYRAGTDEEKKQLYGYWKTGLRIPDSRTPYYNENHVNSYTIQIGESDKREPINVDVDCKNLPSDLGSFTLNGESIYVGENRAIATKIRDKEFIMTQSGFYLNGNQISDSSINSLENACIEYINGRNRLKKWKNVKA